MVKSKSLVRPWRVKQSPEPGSDRSIAKYVVVFMVRGIFSKFQYAFGHLAVKSLIVIKSFLVP